MAMMVFAVSYTHLDVYKRQEYDRWMDTYKGKPAVPGNLEGYYPLEMRITGME